jgi:protein gp37
MAFNSHIEWTETTWNPVTGCTKLSAGCKHCYSERIALRLQGAGQSRYRNGFGLTLQEDIAELPLRWRKPRLVFVNSMSDLFHEDIPADYIRRVFSTMVRARQHTCQILTKRAERLAELAPSLPWPENVWMGVSVENERYTWRIDHLRAVPARVRFLSLEPLLGPLSDLDFTGIKWVIVGGESGPGARRMKEDWVTDIRRQCEKADVAFFFKQWGGVHKKRNGRALDGRTYDEMPHRQRTLPLLTRREHDPATPTRTGPAS